MFIRIIFYRILAHPPPSPDATILNYLNDRERGGGGLSFVGFRRLPMPPSPSTDATILNYLKDREKGRHYPVIGFNYIALNFVTVFSSFLGGGGGGALKSKTITKQMFQIFSCKFPHNYGEIIFKHDFGAPPPLGPGDTNLTILMIGRGDANIL